MKVESLSHVQLFATPWTVAHQAPLPTGCSRREHGSGLPGPSSRGSSDPGTEPASPKSPASAGGLFTISTTWKGQENQQTSSQKSI